MFLRGLATLMISLVTSLYTGHVISVGDVLATLCLRRVERRGWVGNFQDLSLPGHLLPLTAEGAMFVIMGMGGGAS